MKARTPTSAPGSSLGAVCFKRGRADARGFTLIELLVVLTIIALGAGLVSLALRDGAQNRLDQEGSRLSALLESARAEARVSGLEVRFELASPDSSDGAQFRFIGLPPERSMPTQWLGDGLSAQIVGARALQLGPEPIIGPQRILLQLDDRQLVLATDGLGPFVPEAPVPP